MTYKDTAKIRELQAKIKELLLQLSDARIDKWRMDRIENLIKKQLFGRQLEHYYRYAPGRTFRDYLDCLGFHPDEKKEPDECSEH